MKEIDENDVDDGRVAGNHTTKTLTMDSTLARKVAQFTGLQKRYAEYRAKGFKQSDSALKAGSKASDRAALGRVGYSFEQLDGMKEYISFLYEKRARASVIDEIELVEKLRAVFEESMEDKNFTSANKSVELMGLMIGAFKKDAAVAPKESSSKTKTSNNLEAFKEADQDVSSSDKLKSINSLMKSMNLHKDT